MRTVHCSKKRQRGMTLVETMIAMVILTTTLASAWGLLTFLLRANQFGLELTQATAVAQYKLEELISEDYDTLASGTETIGVFSLSWVVSTPTAMNLKAIQLTANWTSRTGQPHTTSVKTMVAKVE